MNIENRAVQATLNGNAKTTASKSLMQKSVITTTFNNSNFNYNQTESKMTNYNIAGNSNNSTTTTNKVGLSSIINSAANKTVANFAGNRTGRLNKLSKPLYAFTLALLLGLMGVFSTVEAEAQPWEVGKVHYLYASAENISAPAEVIPVPAQEMFAQQFANTAVEQSQVIDFVQIINHNPYINMNLTPPTVVWTFDDSTNSITLNISSRVDRDELFKVYSEVAGVRRVVDSGYLQNGNIIIVIFPFPYKPSPTFPYEEMQILLTSCGASSSTNSTMSSGCIEFVEWSHTFTECMFVNPFEWVGLAHNDLLRYVILNFPLPIFSSNLQDINFQNTHTENIDMSFNA